MPYKDKKKAKEHSKKYAKEYRKRPEVIERSRKNALERSRRPDIKRITSEKLRKQKYGMIEGEFDRRFNEQKGLCALCEELLIDKIVVEHNHKTGKVRGLTHQKCNMIVGIVRDDINLLKKAIKYLEKYN